MFIQIVLVAFMLLEFLNVLALYFAPGSKYANAVGVFTAWEQSKRDPALHAFIQYLVNWVAGVKLIFLALLGLIVVVGDAELQRLGERTGRTDLLTQGEQQVALLVCDGRTNAEVAAALFITPRTVEAHLTRVYRKLGVRSRAELIARRSLLDA